MYKSIKKWSVLVIPFVNKNLFILKCLKDIPFFYLIFSRENSILNPLNMQTTP